MERESTEDKKVGKKRKNRDTSFPLIFISLKLILPGLGRGIHKARCTVSAAPPILKKVNKHQGADIGYLLKVRYQPVTAVYFRCDGYDDVGLIYKLILDIEPYNTAFLWEALLMRNMNYYVML